MARDRAFPALRATLRDVAPRLDATTMAKVRAAQSRAERLAESRMRTIKRLLEKLRACRVEGRRLAKLVELGVQTEERLRSLLGDARRAIHEATARQEAATVLLAAERARRADAETLLQTVLDDDGVRLKLKSEIRAFLGLDEPGADGPIGGLLAKLGK
jgi:DNA-directed RNA polymerase subunit F